jgi:hypothetical protein
VKKDRACCCRGGGAQTPHFGRDAAHRSLVKLRMVHALTGSRAFLRAGGAAPGKLKTSKSELASASRLPGGVAPKSALKASGAARRRRRGAVRFKGMVTPTVGAMVAQLVAYTRAGCAAAGWWEALMAALAITDFLCIPLSLVSKAFSEAHKTYETINSTRTDFNFMYVLFALDAMFILNIIFRLCQVRPDPTTRGMP